MKKRALMWDRDHRDGTNYIGREVVIIAETDLAYKARWGFWVGKDRWLPKKLYNGSPRFEFVRDIE